MWRRRRRQGASSSLLLAVQQAAAQRREGPLAGDVLAQELFALLEPGVLLGLGLQVAWRLWGMRGESMCHESAEVSGLGSVDCSHTVLNTKVLVRSIIVQPSISHRSFFSSRPHDKHAAVSGTNTRKLL